MQIPGARAPVINPGTGIMNPVWYRFFELINAEAQSSSNQKLVKKVLFFSDTTTWVVPSGVDYCIAEVCGGGGGGSGHNDFPPAAGANSTVSCGDGTFSGVGRCRSGREFSGQGAFFVGGREGRSFMGVIPAAVNEFGINLTPGETVTITVGAGGRCAGGSPAASATPTTHLCDAVIHPRRHLPSGGV